MSDAPRSAIMAATRILIENAPPSVSRQEVHDLYDLDLLAQEHRSVYCPTLHCWKKPRPAAFVINLQGKVLLQLFQAGMYVYEKEAER